MSDPQGALDLTLALRFGHQRAPALADLILSSARDGLAASPDLVDLALWAAMVKAATPK